MEVLGFERLQLLFIRRKHDFSHSFTDERSKMNGLFGPKQACYIPPLFNIFLFLFYFFAIWK
jgi:hypothetical protein